MPHHKRNANPGTARQGRWDAKDAKVFNKKPKKT